MKIPIEHLFYFTVLQKKNIKAIVKTLNAKGVLTGLIDSLGSGGNHYHIAFQRKDNSWIMFHSATDDVTISDASFPDFDSVYAAFWEDSERVTNKYFCEPEGSEEESYDFQEIELIVDGIINNTFKEIR